MTAILGIKKVLDSGETRVVIASDSLFARGTSKIKSKNRAKLITFPYFIVGFSGICTMQMVLSDILREKAYIDEPFMEMKDLSDALEFSQICFAEIRDRLEAGGGDGGVLDGVGDLVIASHNGLYNIDKYGFVSEHDAWATSGCADDILNGAMGVLYNNITSIEGLKDVANTAILIACEFSTGCEGPVCIEVVGKNESIPKPKKRSRKKS